MKRTVLAAMLLALAACSDKADIATAAASAPAKAIAAPAPSARQPLVEAKADEPNPDKRLGERVGRALEDAKLQGIDIAVTDGNVTLWGAVRSARERTRAGQVARAVEGVKAVDNRLALAAGS